MSLECYFEQKEQCEINVWKDDKKLKTSKEMVFSLKSTHTSEVTLN